MSFEKEMLFRGVAQLVAHHVRDVGVASSNLATPIDREPAKNQWFPVFLYSLVG